MHTAHIRVIESILSAPSLRLVCAPFQLLSESTVFKPVCTLSMHVRCPQCGEYIEFADDTVPPELRCAKCGSTFVHQDGTVSFTPEGAAYQVTFVPKRPDALSRPSQIGDYEIIGEIDRGGMGIIYKAQQRGLNRVVALKMIRSGTYATPTEIARFRAEAQAVAKLEHPGIVPVYDAGENNGHCYLSMALVEGGNLAKRLSQGPLPPRESAAIIKRVAEAVQYAHDHDVIHRDLKPTNVLLGSDGTPRVSDFGLAKNLLDESELTASGEIIGTPSYMSPEQARGEKAGPLADVYSIGATLYCLLTGRPPFQAATTLETLQQVLENEPASPRTVNASIPRDLDTICLHCLEKDPRHRFQSAQELADELGRFLCGDSLRCSRRARIYSWYRWSRRIERIQEAGLVITAVGAWLMFGEVVAFLSTVFGIELLLPLAPPERRAESLVWVSVFFCDGLAIALMGWGVRKHRPIAFILTGAFVVVHLVLVPAVYFGIIQFDMGGILASASSKQMVFLPFMTMILFGGGALLLAACAYFANLERLASRAAISKQSSQ